MNRLADSAYGHLESFLDCRRSDLSPQHERTVDGIARTAATRLERKRAARLEAARRRLVLAAPGVVDEIFKKLDKL